MKEIYGYIRENGAVGIRNYVLVIPSVVCSSETAARIASHFSNVPFVANQHGCVQIGDDAEQTEKTLVNIGKHPNVAAVLVVGLGCETVQGRRVADKIAESGKRVEFVNIQDEGGTLKAEEKGVSLVKDMIEDLNLIKRTKIDFSQIRLGAECGGSDATSGIASNPVVGYVMDKIVESKGITMFSEVPEIIGAEHILAKRAVSKEVSNKIFSVAKKWENLSYSAGVDIRGGQPTPGNIQGGITTIEEKSLGAIHKGGMSPIQDVLNYASVPNKPGLYLMDTPGQDIESVVGMVAGGSQAILFTTGRGTPTGNPIAPVIKITANAETYKKMSDNIDFDASPVMSGKETIEESGEKLFDLLADVINGKLTKAEELNYREFGIYKTISTF
ncbi:MAG: UxaA family hydrolase [Candidatus Micrarchaeaceae archaeon]